MAEPASVTEARLTRYVQIASAILAVLCLVPLALPRRVWGVMGTGVAVPGEAIMLLVCALGLVAGASRWFRVQTAIGAGLLALTLPALPAVTSAATLGPALAVGSSLGISSGSAAAFLIIALSFIAAGLPRLRAMAAGMAGLSLVALSSFVVVERIFGPHNGMPTEVLTGMPAFGPAGALICAFGLLVLGWRDGDRCGGLPTWLPHASATGVYSGSMLLGATLMATYPGESGPLVFASTLILGCVLAVLTGICVRLMQLARERAAQSDKTAAALASSEERLKRALGTLQEQEARYRQMVDGASDIIYRTDDNGHFNFVNAAAERVLETTADKLLGRHYLTLIREDLREAAREFYAEQASQQRANSYYEFPVVTSSGAELWLGQNVQVLADERGVLGFQGLARDITERKQMERALQEAHDRALDSARLKSEFLANMSHEIRTPMNGVIGLVSLLNDTALSATQQAYVDGIRTSGDALLTIINDILDSSKIEAGMLQIESIGFELPTTVTSTLQMFAEPARRKRLELSVRIEDDVPVFVCGDPNRLRQVLTNLIGNAVKFTSEGAVKVYVSNVPRRSGNSFIRIEVQDTGIGLSPDVLARVFQPFVQADSSTTRRYGGTGLGLAISKRLVELMGGTIGADSQAGRGSTFWVAVPLTEVPADVQSGLPTLEARASEHDTSPLPVWSAPAREQPAIRAISKNGRRILVVEDNAVNQAVARGMLEGLGYRVDLAGDGLEALDAIDRGSYAAVLMDCQMPRMDGFSAAAEIRRREAGASRIPIIALTAYATSGERERCLEAGMDDYLSKPVSKADLARVIHQWTAEAATPAPSPAPVQRVNDGAIDLDRMADIREEMGEAGLSELIDMLMTEIEDSAPAFRLLAASGEFAEITRRAHRLKGSCRVLGFEQLASLYDEVECLPAGAMTERIQILAEEIEDQHLAIRALWTVNFQLPTSKSQRPSGNAQPLNATL